MKKNALLLLISAFCIALYSFKWQPKVAEKPNVLFIAVDDLKPLLNCYGATYMHTPNIDRLAKMGTVFMNNYCQQAVCAPTRASLLTGMRPDYTRIWDLKTQIRDMNPSIRTLPQYFKENGYVTAGIGKVFDNRSVDKGEDTPSWLIPYERLKETDFAEGFGRPKRNYYQSPKTLEILARIEAEAKKKGLLGVELSDFMNANRGPAVESADVPDHAYPDGAVANRATKTIAQLAESKQPFFYAVGFSRPHLPFCSPQKYWNLYKRDQIKTAVFQNKSQDAPDFAFQASGELFNNYLQSDGQHFRKGYTPQADSIQKELIHGYYASVSYLDAQVGKLLDALDKNGLAKNTIIVLWGDHGWHLGDHAMWCKHSNFEQATRAPLIITSPNFKGNQKATGLSEFVDVFPTLAALAGLNIPDGLAGKSLVPMLKNPKTSVKHYAVSQYPRKENKDDLMGYSIRTKEFRYTAWFKTAFYQNKTLSSAKPIAVELYNYQHDPNETINVANKPELQQIVKQHELLMTDFLTKQKHTR
ncbi:MAG: sulfatase [Spirosomataceae bacterium]